ncbi:MAG: CPBP family glutamic-type intramembrane protease [SAR324 cluster bacterium]|nr:CPBP family glutamic-type intramembrane protease [SAR324 cluster bacterium]
MSRYFIYSRSAYYGVVAAIPLLIAYELLLTMSGGDISQGQVRNAADVWLRMIFVSFGVSPMTATLGMILILILAIPLLRSGSVRLVPSYFGTMFIEAVAYGFALGIVINYILAFIFSFFQPLLTEALLSPPPAAIPREGGLIQGLALSIGAGLFEELFFRVILLSALLFLTRLLSRSWVGAALAITAAAFLFSLAHYVGPLGEALELHGFLFRWMAGLLFTILYYLRGFAITAYSHALYDVWVITGLMGYLGG